MMVPLIADGAIIEVANENKRRYVYLVAKHHVSDRSMSSQIHFAEVCRCRHHRLISDVGVLSVFP